MIMPPRVMIMWRSHIMPDQYKKCALVFLRIAAFTAIPLFAGSNSTTTLTVSPNPAVFASTTTLTATVAPSSATGSVTFYDGGNFLGSVSLSSGSASFSTKFLPAGMHRLRAFYPGNASLSPSTSATVTAAVNALPVNGVYGPATFSATASPTTTSFGTTAALGDFNGDGLMDIVVTADSGVSLLLGEV